MRFSLQKQHLASPRLIQNTDAKLSIQDLSTPSPIHHTVFIWEGERGKSAFLSP